MGPVRAASETTRTTLCFPMDLSTFPFTAVHRPSDSQPQGAESRVSAIAQVAEVHTVVNSKFAYNGIRGRRRREKGRWFLRSPSRP